MTKIISIANHKGGVGKTTSTASIGVALANKGKRVLLIDLDPQANLTGLFLSEEEADTLSSVYHTLTKGEPLTQHEIKPNLYIAPSALELAKAEIEISGAMARERILQKAIAPIMGNYDYILIDCPPSLGIITTHALYSSDEVYIPLLSEALSLKGISTLEDIIEAVREINGKLTIGGVILNRYDGRKNLSRQVEAGVRARYGDKVFTTVIRDNVAVAEAPLHTEDIFSYAPKSFGAIDYASLADEIISRNR